MDKDEFLSRLREKLKRLPPEDINDAMEYYEEYLEDAGPENEAAVIAAWGSPDTVASQVLADYAVKQMGKNPSARKGLSTIWIVMLAIFASPIAIPVTAVIVIVALILVATVFIVVACVYITAVSLAAVGVLTFITGICLIIKNLSTAVFYIGAGLFCAGAGTAVFVFAVWFSKKAISLIAKMFSGIAGRFFKRRREN